MNRALLAICLIFFLSAPQIDAWAQSLSGPQSDEAEIRAAIKTQTDAWNRADIPAFMQSYED